MQTWNMINLTTMETVELGVTLDEVHEIVTIANKADNGQLWAAVEAD